MKKSYLVDKNGKYYSKERNLWKRFSMFKNVISFNYFMNKFTCDGKYRLIKESNNEIDNQIWNIIHENSCNWTLSILFMSPKSSNYDKCKYKSLSVCLECETHFGTIPKKAFWIFRRVE